MDLPSYRNGTDVYVLFYELLACLVKDMQAVPDDDMVGDVDPGASSRQMQRAKRKRQRQSRGWEEVLPSADSPIGQHWIRMLKERLFVHLPPHLDDNDGDASRTAPTESVGEAAANAVLANVWKRQMEERMRAKADLLAAQRRLRNAFVSTSCQTMH